MATLLNKVLNFVGWEAEEEEIIDEKVQEKDEANQNQNQFIQNSFKKQPGKVVNIHSQQQFKVVITQPDNYDDAQEICDHLKNKKPIVVNLENLEKESAKRVIDFLSGSVYALDGNIQKVSSGIFLIVPNNVDIMADIKDELKSKGVFPWMK